MVMLALAVLVLLAGCGDESFRAQLFDFLEEDARPMNRHESGVYQGTAHCMDLDDQSEPSIEYCVGKAADGRCVDRETYPHAIGQYRPSVDRISILPEWKGVDGLLAHEAIHAILWRRTGDTDPEHRGAFFGTCAEKFNGN